MFMEEDHKRLRKQRAIKVALTEILMFFSVILLVAFLTLIVLGYNFNIKKLGTEEVIERVGLVQVSSIPSGATVTVDGEEGDLFSRTNYSKTLSVGEHLISLKRDGFDSWEKKINVAEGLLLRVSYPRLFLKERERETVLSFSEEELEGIKKFEFSKDGKTLTVTDGEGVRSLDLNDGKPVLKEVKTADLETEEKIKVEEALKLEKKLKELKEKLKPSESEKIELGEYLGEEYVVVYGEEEVRLYCEGDLDSEIIKAIFKKEVGFKVKEVEFRGKGQLIFVYGEDEEEEKKEIYYDFETGEFRENEVKAGEKWLDEYLKYRVLEGEIKISDFDGENRRTLEVAEGVSGKYGVRISMNNKYIYYFVANEDEGTLTLVREKIL